MKILCVFGRYQYGQPELGEGIEYKAFLPALRTLGHDVIHFESWDRSLHNGFAELNQRLLDCVMHERPDVLLAVQRDYEIWTETLETIRALGHTATVNWTTDDSWKYREVSRFIGRHYDAMTTTYDYVVPEYQRDGIPSVLLTQWAANVEWLREPLPASQCRYPVSFVGAATASRRQMVQALAERGVAVECFGNGWASGAIAAERIPEIMSDSVISLNFADPFKSSLQRQIKARTFEVPGAGGMLLTEYAPGVEQFYDIEKEVLTFRTVNDAAAKIQRLLANPAERDAIAIAGYLRTRNEHTYDTRMKEVLSFALDARLKRAAKAQAPAFEEIVKRHRVGFALARARDLFTSACVAAWGSKRGPRAARRAVFELSWRLFGEQTFAASGLPGRLFPGL